MAQKTGRMISKSEIYGRCFKEIIKKVKGLEIHERMDLICEVLKREIPYYFWAGFYFPKGDFLELGPSRGPPACARIATTGVCGKAVKERKAIVVSDVNKFPGHISCDPRSKSEIALPVFDGKGNIIAVLDVDGEELERFDEMDQKWLKKLFTRPSHMSRQRNNPHK